MENQFTATAFNAFLAEHKLMGSRCKDCEKIYLPPRPLCPETYSTDMEWVELSGKGKLVGFTSISIGPAFMQQSGFDRNNPYVTGVVELEEGVRISALIVGVDAKKTGDHPDRYAGSGRFCRIGAGRRQEDRSGFPGQLKWFLSRAFQHLSGSQAAARASPRPSPKRMFLHSPGWLAISIPRTWMPSTPGRAVLAAAPHIPCWPVV